MAKLAADRRHTIGTDYRKRPPTTRATSIEDACTCTVCREAFAEGERPSLVPRILSGCGHTICTGCLAQLIGRGAEQANNEIICPVCRKVTSVPNGDVTHLPSNWSVISLIPCLDYGAMANDPTVCQMGCNENPVVYQCKKCQEYMCRSCAESTAVCRTGSPHRLEEVYSHRMTPPPIALPNKERQDQLCPLHNEAVQLVCCAKQNALLCLVCHLEPEHKGHEHISLNAFSERKNETLQILLRDLKRKQRDFVYGFNISKRTGEELVQEKERIHNQLKKVFGQLEEAIRLRKEDITQQIDRVVEQKLKLLDQEAATMSLTSEDIKQLSSQVEKLTTMGAPFEVVMQADEIIDQGETLLESSRTADSLHSSQVVFDTTGIDDSQAGILAFGKYTFAPGPVENLKVTVVNGQPTSAVLEWDKPNRKWDTGDVEKYTVEWRAVANDETQDRQICFQQIHSASDPRRRVTVCGLTKGLEHKFRVAAVNQAGKGPLVTSQIIKVNEPTFVWDSNRCHPNVRLSNENCTASVGDNAHWICAGGSKVLENGRHYWELQLDRYGIPSPNKKIVAGVVHATGLDPRCWQRNRSIIGLYYSPFNTQSWSLALQTGRKLSQSTPSSGVIYCQRYRFHEGDRVGILVDLDKQTLEYFYNGQSLGVAFEDVKGPVIPAVSFCHHKRVTLHYPPIPKSHEAVKRPHIIARAHSYAGDCLKTKKRHSESSDSTSSLEHSLTVNQEQ